MNMQGLIFDIKQMTLHDGPGVRTTVFFKGCPLKCTWCHNPEGQAFEKELMFSGNSCLKCGKCGICQNPEKCICCGACVSVCPMRLRRVAGETYTPEELAKIILRNKELLEEYGGGVTFSGGEPLSQGAFLFALIKELEDLHTVLETSGYCRGDLFHEAVEAIDLILFDIKIIDPLLHRKFTGVDNSVILENLTFLMQSGKPFIVRVPLIPSVTDTEENLGKIAGLVSGAKGLLRTELLPYHITAGAKYVMLGREYSPGFNINKSPEINTAFFTDIGLECSVL